MVKEHFFAGKCTETVQGPWRLLFFHLSQKFSVSCDSISETHAWCCIEFGNTAQNHQICKFSGQRNCCYCIDVRCKFHVCFVNHDKNIFSRTERNQLSQIFLHDRRRSRIIRITDDQEIIAFFQCFTQIIHIQNKVTFFL